VRIRLCALTRDAVWQEWLDLYILESIKEVSGLGALKFLLSLETKLVTIRDSPRISYGWRTLGKC